MYTFEISKREIRTGYMAFVTKLSNLMEKIKEYTPIVRELLDTDQWVEYTAGSLADSNDLD